MARADYYRSGPFSFVNRDISAERAEANEGVFCSDDRILLGPIAASLVLPLFVVDDDFLPTRRSAWNWGVTAPQTARKTRFAVACHGVK